MKLENWQKHFFNLYGRRNRIFLPGLRERVDFLNIAISDLQEAIRKEQSAQIIAIALARIVARIFCIAEHFWSMPLTETMCRKYPSGHCSYCHNFPCSCSERRPDCILESISGNQSEWDLKRWQEHFNALYGEKNRKKGIENILNRLFKETGELLALQMMIPNMNYDLDTIEEKFALELSDALAWTIAVANFFEVDLEQAVYDRFGVSCWKCNRNPCICKNFNVEPVNWDVIS